MIFQATCKLGVEALVATELRKLGIEPVSVLVARHISTRNMVEDFSCISSFPEANRNERSSIVNADTIGINISSSIICTAHEDGFICYAKFVKHCFWQVLHDALKFLNMNLGINVFQFARKSIDFQITDILNTALMAADVVILHHVRDVSNYPRHNTNPHLGCEV